MGYISCGSYCEEMGLVRNSREISKFIWSKSIIITDIEHIWTEVWDNSKQDSQPFNSYNIYKKLKKDISPNYP